MDEVLSLSSSLHGRKPVSASARWQWLRSRDNRDDTWNSFASRETWYVAFSQMIEICCCKMLVDGTAVVQVRDHCSLTIVSLFCARNINTVEFNSGVRLLKS